MTAYVIVDLNVTENLPRPLSSFTEGSISIAVGGRKFSNATGIRTAW